MAVVPTVRCVRAEGRRRSPMSHHDRPECFDFPIGLLCVVCPRLVPDRVGLILRARTTYPEYYRSRLVKLSSSSGDRKSRPSSKQTPGGSAERPEGRNNINDADQPMHARSASNTSSFAVGSLHPCYWSHPYPPIHPRAGLRTRDLYNCHTAGHETPLLSSKR